MKPIKSSCLIFAAFISIFMFGIEAFAVEVSNSSELTKAVLDATVSEIKLKNDISIGSDAVFPASVIAKSRDLTINGNGFTFYRNIANSQLHFLAGDGGVLTFKKFVSDAKKQNVAYPVYIQGIENTVDYYSGIDRVDKTSFIIEDSEFRNYYNNNWPGGGPIYGGRSYPGFSTSYIKNSTFKNNETHYVDVHGKPLGGGGAIFNHYTYHEPGSYGIVVTGSTFEENLSNATGGAIQNAFGSSSASTAIKTSKFKKNKAVIGGGAIAAGGSGSVALPNTVLIENNEFTENEATAGGAIYLTGGENQRLIVNNNTFNKNLATSTTSTATRGGAIAFCITQWTTGNIVSSLAGNTFTQNSVTNSLANGSAGGGAIAVKRLLTLDIYNSDFSQNSAIASHVESLVEGETQPSALGGAFYLSSEQAGLLFAGIHTFLTDVNFTDNYAWSESGEAKGGAIYIAPTGRSMTLVAKDEDVTFQGNYTKTGDGVNTDIVVTPNAIHSDIVDNSSTKLYSINMNASVDKSIIFNDPITSSATSAINGILLNINKPAEGLPSAGTIVLNSDMTGYLGTINFYNGTIKMGTGRYVHPTLGEVITTPTWFDEASVFNIVDNGSTKNAVLDLQNGKTNDVVSSIFKFNDDLDLKIDVNMTTKDGKATSSDSINLASGSVVAAGKTLNLSSINVTGSGTQGNYSNYIQYVTGDETAKSKLNYTIKNGTSSTQLTDQLLEFTLGNKGCLNVNITDKGATLSQFIKGFYSDSSDYLNVPTYAINADTTTGAIGTTHRSETNRDLNLYLNNGSVISSTPEGVEGITVDDGYSLNVVGSSFNENKSKMSGFATALKNNTGGKLTVEDMVFDSNTTDIVNDSKGEDIGLYLNGSNNLANLKSSSVTPTGKTVVESGETTVTNALEQAVVQVNTGATLSITDFDNVVIAESFVNAGTLKISDGNIDHSITGEGHTKITGNVINDSANAIIQKDLTIEKSKFFDTNVSDLTISSKTITNEGDLTLKGGTAGVAVDNDNAITGDGSTTFEGEVNNTAKVSQDVTIANDAVVTSAITNLTGNIENNSVLNVNGDVFDNDVAGLGTTVLQSDTVVPNNVNIAGTLNLNDKTVNMQDGYPSESILSVNKLIAGNSDLKIDVNMKTATSGTVSQAYSNDKLVVANTESSGILDLTSVNVIDDGTPGEYNNYVRYVDGAGASALTYYINGATSGNIVNETENRLFTFTLGDKGYLNVKIVGLFNSLEAFVQGKKGSDAVPDYYISADKTLSPVTMGTTYRVEGLSKDLKLHIKNASTVAASGSPNSLNGVTVASGYIFNVLGSIDEDAGKQATMTNFKTALINNAGGILNVSNMKFENNTNDIYNHGVLNLSGEKISFGSNVSYDGYTACGTTNISAKEVIFGNLLKQKDINIGMISAITISATNLIATNMTHNEGIINFLAGKNSYAITGGGTLNIAGAVTNAAAIEQNTLNVNDVLTNNSTISTAILNLDANIAGSGTLTLTGVNDLSEKTATITQAGLTNSGNLTANVETISAATSGIVNTGTLTLKGSTEENPALVQSNVITGTGSTTFTGNVNNTAAITQGKITNTGNLTNSGAINAAVNNVAGATMSTDKRIIGSITNDGNLIITTFNNNNFYNSVVGDGVLEFAGDWLNINSGIKQDKIIINIGTRIQVSISDIKTTSGIAFTGNNSSIALYESGTNLNTIYKTKPMGKLAINNSAEIINKGLITMKELSIGSGSSLESDIDLLVPTETITNNGTFKLIGDLKKDVDGSGTTVLQSNTVKSNDTISIDGKLDMNGKTIDMQGDEGLSTLTVGNLLGTGNLKIDADLATTDSAITPNSDKINITSGASNSATINLTAVNVTSDGANTINYVTGAKDTGITYQINGAEGSLKTATGNSIYTFTSGGNGTLSVSRTVQDMTLQEFITGAGAGASVNTYSINGGTLDFTSAIGSTVNRSGDKILNLFLNDGASLIGNNTAYGIGVISSKSDGSYTLNLTGSNDADGEKASMKNFKTALYASMGSGSITNLNIDNIKFEANTTNGNGGAILGNADSYIKNSEFVSNSALSNGGALSIAANTANSAIIENTLFDGNVVGNSSSEQKALGGAISVMKRDATKSLYISNSEFKSNQALAKDSLKNVYAQGGAIYTCIATTLNNVKFEENSVKSKDTYNSTAGGAIYNDEVSLIISAATKDGSIFRGNTSVIDGGAISIKVSDYDISNTLFENNIAGRSGGAIHDYKSNGKIYNATFKSNEANIAGGAINISSVSGEKSVIDSSTFDGNKVVAKNITNTIVGGGAINIANGTLEITNSSFTNNIVTTNDKAYSGGGAISSNNSDLTIDNSTFIGNIAVQISTNISYSGGGAVLLGSGNNSTTTITNSIFKDNGKLIKEDGTFEVKVTTGGAITANAWFDIENSLFESNSAFKGGAIYVTSNDYNSSIKDSIFRSNSSAKAGGAIYYDSAREVVHSISGSIFEGNNVTASSDDIRGGAIYSYGHGSSANTLTISDSQFNDNTVTSKVGGGQASGGAVYVATGNPLTNVSIENSSFVGNMLDNKNNEASKGGALHVEKSANLSDVIFRNNTADSIHTAYGGAIYAGDNLTVTATEFGKTIFEENYVGVNATSTRSGGAIDSGNNTLISNAIFRYNYVADSGYGGAINSGRFEITNSLFEYNGLQKANPANPADVVKTSQGGAINLKSNIANVSIIKNTIFRNNASTSKAGTIYIGANSSLSITDSMFLNNSSGAGGAIWGYTNSSLDLVATEIGKFVFSNNTATSSAGAVNIDNLYADKILFENNYAMSKGGAISTSNATIKNSEFHGNTTDFGSNYGAGGAIYFNSSENVVSDSLFDSNMSRAGGAIYIANTVISSTISNSTFKNNYASYQGGAISASGNLIINNSIFTDNTSNNEAGAILVNSTVSVSIADSYFNNNSAPTNGGAILLLKANDKAAGDEAAGYITRSQFINNSSACGGALIIGINRNLTITDSSFIDNIATGTKGGAIFMGKNSTLSLVAENSDVLFAGNTVKLNGNTVSNAIYQESDSSNASVLNMNANKYRSIVFNDRLTSTSTNSIMNVNPDINSVGTVVLNEDMSKWYGTINLYNGTIKMGAGSYVHPLTGETIYTTPKWFASNSIININPITTLNNEGETVELSNNPTLDLQNESYDTITGVFIFNDNLDLKIDVDMATKEVGSEKVATASDLINLAINSDGNDKTLNITSINVTNNGEVGSHSKYIQYVSGSGLDTLRYTINNRSNYTQLKEQLLKFIINEASPGYLDVEITNVGASLSQFIKGQINPQVPNYAINEDLVVADADADIGTTSREGSHSKDLNLYINNASTIKVDGETRKGSGITVDKGGYTLNVLGSTLAEKTAKFSNFITALKNTAAEGADVGGILNVEEMLFENNTTAIVNNSELNMQNVVFKDNTTAVENNSVMNLAGVNTFKDPITGTGTTTILSGSTTIEDSITQSVLAVNSAATLIISNPSGVVTTAHNIINEGIVTLNGGTNSLLITDSDNSGSNGTLNFTGVTTNTGTIKQKIVNIQQQLENSTGSIEAKTLSINADLTNNSTITTEKLNLSHNILGSGTLTLTGSNDLTSRIATVSQGTINIDESAAVDAKVGQILTTITNEGTLKLFGGSASLIINTVDVVSEDAAAKKGSITFANQIENAASITQKNVTNDGILVNSGTIVADILTNSLGSTLTTAADTITAPIQNEGTLVFNAASTNSNVITGSGTLSIDTTAGVITNTASITQGLIEFITGNNNFVTDASLIHGNMTVTRNLSLVGGTNQNTITGNSSNSKAGTIYIDGTVANEGEIGVKYLTINNGSVFTSSLDDLKGTDTITINGSSTSSSGRLNLVGDLTKTIKSNDDYRCYGEVVLQSDTAKAITSNVSIGVALNMNGKTIDMQDADSAHPSATPTYTTLKVGHLTGTGNLKIDVNMNSKASDNIFIESPSKENLNNAILNLTAINVTEDIDTIGTYANHIIYVAGRASSLTDEQLTLKLDGDEAKIVTATDNYQYTFTSGITKGKLSVFVESIKTNLKTYIIGTGGAQANSYSINNDLLMQETIGETHRDEGLSKVLQVNINNGSVLSASSEDPSIPQYEGITVASGYTLNMIGADSEDGSKNATMSNFTTALKNLAGGTLNVNNITFAGNVKDIDNAGILNLLGENISFASPVTYEGETAVGTTNISAKNVTFGSIFKQKQINIESDSIVNAAVGNLIASDIKNDGTLMLTTGVDGLSASISGTGTLNFSGSTNSRISSPSIVQDNLIIQSGPLEIANLNGLKITNAIQNNGTTLTLYGIWNVEAPAINTNTIEGSGRTTFYACTLNNAPIKTELGVNTSSILTTDASYLQGEKVLDVMGTLILTGGEIKRAIIGVGDTNTATTKIAGDVINSSTIYQNKVDILEGGKLTTNVGVIAAAKSGIANAGELVMNGSAGEAAALEQTNAISGAGKTIFTGNVDNTGSIEQKIVEITSGAKVSTNADKITTTEGGTGIANAGTLTLNGGANTNLITGAGTTIVDGTVSTAKNIETALKVNAGKTFNVEFGTTSLGALTNDGTTNIKTDFTITNGITATGSTAATNITSGTTTLDSTITKQAVAVSSGATLKVGTGSFASSSLNLAGGATLDLKNDDTSTIALNNFTASDDAENRSNLFFDVKGSSGSIISDTINVTTTASGNLENIINIVSDLPGAVSNNQQIYVGSIDLFIAGDSVTVDMAKTITNYGAYKYEFIQDVDNKGKLKIYKQSGFSLPVVIHGPEQEALAINGYSWTTDLTIFDDLGTLTRADGMATRELTLNGNNAALLANGYGGVTVNADDTLNVINVNGFKDFEETAITNAGNVKLSGVTFENNNTDINNTGALTIGTGTTTLSGGIIGSGSISIDADGALIAAANKIAIGTPITIANAGSLTLKGDSDLFIENENNINSDGSTIFENKVKNSGTITQSQVINKGELDNTAVITAAVSNAQNAILVSSVSNIVGSISNEGSLTLKGNLVSTDNTNAITGTTGSTIFEGNVHNKANITQSSLTNKGILQNDNTINANIINKSGAKLTSSASNLHGAIENAGYLYFTEGENQNAITGSGTTQINGDILNSALITQGTIEITGSNSLKTSASNLIAQSVISNNGILTFTSGNNTSLITTGNGTAKTIVDGTVSTTKNIETAITVNAGKTFNVDAGTTYLGALTNDGTININTGFTITNGITATGSTAATNITSGTTTLNSTISAQAVAVSSGATLKVGSTGLFTDSSLSLAGGAKIDLRNAVMDEILLNNFTASDDAENRSVLSFDVKGDSTIENNATSDKFKVTGTGSAIGNVLNEINLISEIEGEVNKNVGYIDLFTGSGIAVNIAETSTNLGMYKYTFTQVSENSGKLKIYKSNGYTLPEVIHGITGDSSPLTVETYSWISDLELGADMGTLTRKNSSVPRTLNLNGNGTALLANGHGGVTVNAGDTLNVTNVNGFKDFAETAITNAGNVKLSGVTFENNTIDVNNTGALTIGKGTTTLSGGITGSGSISIDSDGALIAAVNKITTGSPIANAGSLTLKGDVASALENNNSIIGTGSTTFENKVVNKALISQNVNIASNAELTSSASNIVGDVSNLGVYNIVGGTLNNQITGSGITNLTENSLLTIGSNMAIDQTFNADKNSTISMLGAADNISINGLSIDNNKIMNLEIDWNDKFNSTSSDINGRINISSIDLTQTDGTISDVYDDYLITSTVGDKMLILKSVKLVTTETSFNEVKYVIDGTKGTLYGAKTSLKTAITDNIANVRVYSMSTDESGTDKPLKTGDLIVQGSGNTVNSAGITVDNEAGGSKLTLVDTNVSNVTTSETNSGAITVKGNNIVHIIAEENNVVLQGTTGDNQNAIFLDDVNGKAQAILEAKEKNITIDNDIRSNNVNNKIALNGSNTIIFNGILDPATIETVGGDRISNNYNDEITWNLNGGRLLYINDSYLYDSTMHGSTYQLNTMNFNGGALDLRNNAANDISLASMSILATSNLYLDVNAATQAMDRITANTINNPAGDLVVKGLNIFGTPTENKFDITFLDNTTLNNYDQLKGHIKLDDTAKTVNTGIYKYTVDYITEDSLQKELFRFAVTGGGNNFDPAVLASPVAAQVGSYLTQLNIYEQAFGNMDMLMNMPRAQRLAMKYANKYASTQGTGQGGIITFSPNQIPEQEKGGWFRPFATFENVGLNGGPTVGNVSYGSLFGGDSEIKELSNGWDMVYSIYAGYNGSHQTFDGVGIYQNGGTVGASAAFYKGNFFTGLTANVGANVGEANTAYGSENFTMLTAGIASKTGYNFEFADGKFIIQPNWLMSYTFVNTFDYTNAKGIKIDSDPLNAIQIAPGLKFIGNLKNGLQPYASVQMVWNIMDKTRFTANDISLPEMSIDPYIQYGIGLQKRWGDRFTGYGQAMIRNGGRNGIALQFGFRWALGKAPVKNGEQIKSNQYRKTSNIPEIQNAKFSK